MKNYEFWCTKECPAEEFISEFIYEFMENHEFIYDFMKKTIWGEADFGCGWCRLWLWRRCCGQSPSQWRGKIEGVPQHHRRRAAASDLGRGNLGGLCTVGRCACLGLQPAASEANSYNFFFTAYAPEVGWCNHVTTHFVAPVPFLLPRDRTILLPNDRAEGRSCQQAPRAFNWLTPSCQQGPGWQEDLNHRKWWWRPEGMLSCDLMLIRSSSSSSSSSSYDDYDWGRQP